MPVQPSASEHEHPHTSKCVSQYMLGRILETLAVSNVIYKKEHNKQMIKTGLIKFNEFVDKTITGNVYVHGAHVGVEAGQDNFTFIVVPLVDVLYQYICHQVETEIGKRFLTILQVEGRNWKQVTLPSTVNQQVNVE